MKHSHPQEELIVAALQKVFALNWRADRALQSVLRSAKHLSFSSRGQIAIAVQDIIRYWRLYWACSGRAPDLSEAGLRVLITVRTALAAASLDTPHSAEIRRRHEQLHSSRPVRESIPDWLDVRGEKELGIRWAAVLAALNAAPQQVLRVNTLKVTIQTVQEELTRAGITVRTVSWAPEALVLESHADIYHQSSFRRGWFEAQDAASQAVARALKTKPGMRVIDACAGNGGKSLHLAALMGNRGRILSLDVDGRKLAELSRRARRAGAHIIEPRLIDGSKTVKRLAASADRVLLDVPCSGTGAWRRNPEIKWRLQEENLLRLQQEQRAILGSYSRMVKAGGWLAYVTCSVLPSEGEEPVRAFLEKMTGAFSLIEEKRFSPDVEGFDGFYIAILVRNA